MGGWVVPLQFENLWPFWLKVCFAINSFYPQYFILLPPSRVEIVLIHNAGLLLGYNPRLYQQTFIRSLAAFVKRKIQHNNICTCMHCLDLCRKWIGRPRGDVGTVAIGNIDCLMGDSGVGIG